MTTRRMLIDATHPEETRVVILNGSRLEDFDVEVASHKQLKGNIYLAKVTRVEPSLQAAFVEYGGNRHGFLAFNEIHPDYYQIPVADREALLAQQASEEIEDDEVIPGEDGDDDDAAGGTTVETVGGDDIEEVGERRPHPSPRHYKIQEVVKRRQILLVQVVKEERGNKGAALTTYLSLAGRYCVLMPNTARGGGISRKITSGADRKRLRSLISEFKIPGGIAVIIRTAGAERSKAEIKRDYEYLMRLWESVRELTLKSSAPSMVYEEANLIKRSIRDLYSRDIDEIIVDNDDCYRAAKDFMKLLIPSHAKRVQPYRDPVIPMFHRYQVESQMAAMHSPIVQLKSGGYIVINPTEALVAIDVNSGRSTRERNIEETALKTNLEAASEVARQLRLRDLAGLIVIDFIDMEVRRNQTQVERRLKDDMRTDRARIQLGRISPFGLLELSRQRLRPSLFETNFDPCPNCAGTGIRRSTESTALHILRAIEEEGTHQRSSEITVDVPVMVALYILNQKRTALNEIETRYGFSVMLNGDDSLIPPEFRLERTKTKTAPPDFKPLVVEEPESEDTAEDTAEDTTASTGAPSTDPAPEDEGKRRRRRRPRRRKRGEEDRETTPDAAESETPAIEDAAPSESAPEKEADHGEAEDDDAEESRAKRRRRGKRGGRRRPRKTTETQADAAETTQPELDAVAQPGAPQPETPQPEPIAAEEPEPATPDVVAEAPVVSDEAPVVSDEAPVVSDEAAPETETETAAPEEKKPAAPKTTRRASAAKTSTTTRTRTRKPKTAETAEPTENKEEAAEASTAATDEEKPAPKPRRQRKAPAAAPKTKAKKPEAGETPPAEPVAASPEMPVETAVEAAPPPPSPALAPTPAPSPSNGTMVIDVGSENQEEESEPKTRRGWWQRLTS